jgi:glycerol-3-phosphate dehydrogenase (NAD(P)+)
VLSVVKGIERGSLRRMTQIIAEESDHDRSLVGVLSGPNLAREVAEGQPAATVIALADEGWSARLQDRFMSPTFRVYTNTDVVGCELAGTTKNVIALAVGVADGLGYGDNAKASVITRGLAETGRLGMAMGADPMTMMGLAGMGDLVATCSSPLSRNRTFGEKLGRGMSIDEIVASTRQVAEGVKSSDSVSELAEFHGVDMPIVEQVAALIRGETTPKELVAALVSRTPKPEVR